MNNKFFYQNKIVKMLQNQEVIVIYGAGIMGKALKKCLEDPPYNMHITCFMVESSDNNPSLIGNTPVIDIKHGSSYKNALILIALHEKYVSIASERLLQEGFLNLVPLTFDSDEWSDIRGNWFRHFQMNNNIPYIDLVENICQSDNYLHVYIVHSVVDRKLKENVDDRDFEIPIQAGAALTSKCISSIRDNQGHNISEKNNKYCELTVLYWIWKNDNSKYAGLCHYRRRFQIDEKLAERLVNSSIDVVVTVPILNFPNVRQQYCIDHEQRDLDIAMEAIRSLCPEYMEAAEAVQKGIYYYGYNMFIARKEILNSYCEWLFPILYYCEEKIGEKEDSYQNRYIGFLSERLMTIYFLYNGDKYKIAIAKKHFINTEY